MVNALTHQRYGGLVSGAEIGQARIVKFDDRGKNNKRFSWELLPPSTVAT